MWQVQWNRWVFWVYLAITPIIYSLKPSMDLRQSQMLAFHTLGMMFCVTLTRNIWITLFFFLNLLLLFTTGFETGQGQTASLFIAICIFISCRALFKKIHFMKETNILLGIGVISAIWMGLQMLGIDPLYMGQDGAGKRIMGLTFSDPIGLFGLKAHNAIFFAILIPILAHRNIFYTLPCFIPIWISRSSGAGLAGAVALMFVVYYFKRRWFKWILALGLIFCVLFIGFKDRNMDRATFNSRFHVWHSAVKFSFQKPLGWGPDSWSQITRDKKFQFHGDQDQNHWIRYETDKGSQFRYYNPNIGKASHPDEKITSKLDQKKSWSHWDSPHNEYLQILFEYGFIGLFIFIMFMKELIYRFRNTVKTKELIVITGCLLVYATSSITQFPLHVARLGFLFPVLLGAFFAQTDRNGGTL